jgi:glycerophosphoryl diester phosphodiesterase
VPPRLPSLLSPPILFAHRGASAHARENTIEAFVLARRLGASGLESDAWVTADGVPVLHHDGATGWWFLRRKFAGMLRKNLPAHVPELGELYEACGVDFELSLDVKDPAAVDAVVGVAREFGAAERLWLCHPDWHLVASWRQRFPEVRLVDSTRLRRIREGPERRAAQLADAGVDAVNLHHSDWSGGLTTLFHRFGLLAVGWDAQFDRVIEGLLDMGIDGVHGDHVDRLVASLHRIQSA